MLRLWFPLENLYFPTFVSSSSDVASSLIALVIWRILPNPNSLFRILKTLNLSKKLSVPYGATGNTYNKHSQRNYVINISSISIRT